MKKTLLVPLFVVALSATVLVSFGGEGIGGAWSRLTRFLAGESDGAGVKMWCPMDPQIVKQGEGTCPICSMELVPFESGNVGPPGVLVLSDRQIQQTGVRVASVRTRDLVREIDATGKLEVHPASRTTVRLTYPGKSRVVKAHVFGAGSRVNDGAVVLEVANAAMTALLDEYREATRAFGTFKKNRQDAAATEELKRINRVRTEIVSYGLPAPNLAVLASSPKHLFDAPEFPVVMTTSGTVLSDPKLYEGAELMQGDALFEVADLSRLWLFIDVFEHEQPLVAVGADVEFRTLAAPDMTFHTRVEFIEPLVDRRSQTVRARARVSNAKERLAPGMFVRAVIDCPVDGVLAVPESAVLQSGRRDVVIVAEGSGRYRPKLVAIGRRHLELAQVDDADGDAFDTGEERFHEVLDGLRDGDRVVVAGNFLLNAEAQFQGILKKMLAAEEAQERAPELDAGALATIESVFGAYFALTQRFVEDDASKVEADARALANAASASAEGPAAAALGRIAANAQKLAVTARADTLDWDGARTHYGSISRDVVGLLRDFLPLRVADGELFLFECPMADDFGYEFWVQRTDGIENPYMGQMMLECGSPASL